MGPSIVSNPEPAPADSARTALAATIKQAGEAHEAMARHRRAIEKTRAEAKTAEKLIKTAEEGIEEAKQSYADALAAAAATDAPAPVSRIREARQRVVDCTDEAAAKRDALQKLNLATRDYEHEARQADIAVEAAISAVLAQQVQALVNKGREIARHLAPIWQTLLAHLADNTATGVVDVAAFQKGRGPLVGIEKEVRELLYSANAINEKQPNPWHAARVLLRADPYSPLPDFTTSSPTSAE